MVEHLQTAFPQLRTTTFRITSSVDDVYNCVAWAVNDVHRWWWPTGESNFYWPANLPATVTVPAFQAMLESMNFEVCNDTYLQSEFDRVAVFADRDSIPTHAARQLRSGLWTSKLGRSVDIEHELHALEGSIYGTVSLVLRRFRDNS